MDKPRRMPNRFAFYPIACLLVLSAGNPWSAQETLDYPQWRGVGRDGAASGFIPPESWPDTLTRRWKVEVGEGYSTPILIKDTAFVFARRDGQEGLTAINAETGVEVWRSNYAAPYTP